MNVQSKVMFSETTDYARFYNKSGLSWYDIVELLNYGTGIAFHDVKAADVNAAENIREHFIIAQDSILKHLAGRGCKMLAEPNGNKTYLEADKPTNLSGPLPHRPEQSGSTLQCERGPIEKSAAQSIL